MLKHIVMFRFKDEKKEENIAKTKELLEDLDGKIDELLKIEVGINKSIEDAGGSDLVLYSKFKDLEALDIYQKHPEHLRVLAFIKEVICERRVVDY